MKSFDVKKLIIRILPFVLFFYLFDKSGQAFRLAQGVHLSGKLLNIGGGFSTAFANPLPSFHVQDMLVGIVGTALVALALQVKRSNAKKYRKGVEYGSARWGTPADIAPYIAPVFDNNILLTQTERLMMNSRPKNPGHARNKNVLVIGGSGSGKTRFFVKPNLMQCTSKDFPVSFCVTDPKGSVVVECGKLLQKEGYRIKILNTINFKKSMHYNPFAYIHSEKDILKLVTTLVTNTKGEGKGGDDFWVKAEVLLYTALIGYIHYEGLEKEKNFSTLIEMLGTMVTREDDEDFQNPIDELFENLEHKKPNHFAVRQFKKYKLAAGDICSERLIHQYFLKYW